MPASEAGKRARKKYSQKLKQITLTYRLDSPTLLWLNEQVDEPSEIPKFIRNLIEKEARI